jgi:HD-GYP domain-containing protein (c-di-GMP phosphodiesterase class II)
MGARLIAVADAFDTMTTDRSYRSGLNIDYAMSELKSYAGTQFCPVAVEAFISSFLAHVKS